MGSLLAGFADTFFNIIKVQVHWEDIAYIWLYDVCGLIVIDLLKYILGLMKLGWMSAGAAGGVLEYAELPEEADTRASAHRATPFGSRAGSRAMVRSGILGSSGVGA